MRMTFKPETSEHLEQVLAFEKDNTFGKLGELLLAAMNDWPTQNLWSVEQFVAEVSAVFGSPTTTKKLKSVKFNGANAWELESAASLIKLLRLAAKELCLKDLEQLKVVLLEYFEKAYGDTDFIAELKYKTTEEGGRSTPAFSKYRPQVKFEFEEIETSGEQTFINKDQVMPGESVQAKIRILGVELFRNRLAPGMSFEFREGARVIGNGKILEILNEELKNPSTGTYREAEK